MKNYFWYILITLFMLPLSLLSMENPAENNHAKYNVPDNKRKRKIFDASYESEHWNDQNNHYKQELQNPYSQHCDDSALQPHGSLVKPCDPTPTQTDADDAFVADLLATIDPGLEDFQQILPQSSTHQSSTPSKLHLCPICKKFIARSDSLKVHLDRHADNRSFKCESCVKSFITSTELKRHQGTHTGKRPFKCNNCNKTFIRSYELKNHKCNQVCNSCDKSFSSSSELKTHQQTHRTGHKPFKCNHCDESFINQSKLTIHERRKHTGEKPFPCDNNNCNKSFTTASELKRHQGTHTDKKPFECDICGKTYTRKDRFNQHKKRIHNE